MPSAYLTYVVGTDPGSAGRAASLLPAELSLHPLAATVVKCLFCYAAVVTPFKKDT